LKSLASESGRDDPPAFWPGKRNESNGTFFAGCFLKTIAKKDNF
jgi:hypothetical protein